MEGFEGIIREEDIKEIREKIEEFCEKYNVSLDVETMVIGYTTDGKTRGRRIQIDIIS